MEQHKNNRIIRPTDDYVGEFGRKVLFSTERPTFSELEDHIKQSKSK